MLKLDPGDPSRAFLYRLRGYWMGNSLVQLVLLQDNWQWPRVWSREICRKSWDSTNSVSSGFQMCSVPIKSRQSSHIARVINNNLFRTTEWFFRCHYGRQELVLLILFGISYVSTIMERCFNNVPLENWFEKSMFGIFFTGEKLKTFDSLPKGPNMDSSDFYNTVLEGSKPAPLLRPGNRLWEISTPIWTTAKDTVPSRRKENWTRSGSFDGTSFHIHLILHPQNFWFFE
jgi:hypothetical protein